MILFCGDTHGDFKNINRAIKEHKPSAVVFLGDIEAPGKLEDILLPGPEVYWIPGNHEFEVPEHYTNLVNGKWGANNLSGRVVEVDGVRIAGIGGTFNRKIWWPPEEPMFESIEQWDYSHSHKEFFAEMRREASGSIFMEDYLNTMVLQADVLVSHEAPSCHPYGFEAIDELAQSMGVQKMFHGHHHDDLDYSEDVDRLGFTPFGIGLCGVKSIDGIVLIPGKLDEERMASREARKENGKKFLRGF